MEPTQGIVYVLANPAMPDMVKIGMSTADDVQQRMAQLYTTGVPLPFECIYAARVANCAAVERALHTAFGPNRINPRREFFSIEAGQAIAIIKLLEVEDVTPLVKAKEAIIMDEIDREASDAYVRRRPRFSFSEMGIPEGSELVCVTNGEVITVQSDRTVLFRSEETSLTNATRVILGNSYHVAPGPYWTYNGRKLRSIYNDTYEISS